MSQEDVTGSSWPKFRHFCDQSIVVEVLHPGFMIEEVNDTITDNASGKAQAASHVW